MSLFSNFMETGDYFHKPYDKNIGAGPKTSKLESTITTIR